MLGFFHSYLGVLISRTLIQLSDFKIFVLDAFFSNFLKDVSKNNLIKTIHSECRIYSEKYRPMRSSGLFKMYYTVFNIITKTVLVFSVFPNVFFQPYCFANMFVVFKFSTGRKLNKSIRSTSVLNVFRF